MKTININTMKVEDILRKDAFRRAKPYPYKDSCPSENPDYNSNLSTSKVQYYYPSQYDFLREYDPNSHRIKSLEYYPNLILDSRQKGKAQAKARTRIAIAWQRRIHTKRVTALTGYDPDITTSKSKSDKTSQEYLAKFKEGWSVKGMDVHTHLAIRSDLLVGDTALCGYKDNGRFGCRVFAFDKGDILYPHFNHMTGDIALFGRMFSVTETNKDNVLCEVSYLDVWDDTYYMQYRKDSSDGTGKWNVSIEPIPHAFPFCPVAYHRYGEPCWAGSQSLIEQHELAMSQLAENNAQYALRILYALGAEFEMEGTIDGTPRMINSSDPNAKLGFLEPADSSRSYELQLHSLEKEIMRCSFAVESPELKSGADVSSLTVKTLMADSYIKALDDAKEYQAFLDKIVMIFTEGFGTESGMLAEFKSLNIQIRLQPWCFMADSEVVNTLVQLTAVGILSKQSATEMAYETLGLGSLDEAKRLLQEKHDELLGTTEGTSANGTTTNVVNQARNSR